MNAYDEMRKYQDEWDNEQRRLRYDPHGDIITSEDIEAWTKAKAKIIPPGITIKIPITVLPPESFRKIK